MNPSPAGYSGTALIKKLGIKENFKISLYNIPADYFNLIKKIPSGVQILKGLKIKKDFIHYFTKQAESLVQVLPGLKQEIEADGMIWISWPKKSSKVYTDLTEDGVRATALKSGLVDVKVCAVDKVWSGLKLVIPVKERRV